MNELETSMARRAARLMRSARKQKEFNQREVALRLGITQGNLSKMENGILVPSAPQWFEFCEMTGISPISLTQGYLERNSPAQLRSGGSEGGFSLPSDYSRERGSKVRAMIPFLAYFEKTFGEDKLESYLESLRLDPDFFVNFDNQISMNFCLDISRYLIGKGFLRTRDIPKIVKPIQSVEMHGSIHQSYNEEGEKTKPLNRLRILLMNSASYECNFQYQIEEDQRRSLIMSVKAGDHLKDLDYRDDPTLGDFLCQYKKAYFQRFASPRADQEVTLEERQCHYHGAESCVYELAAAS